MMSFSDNPPARVVARLLLYLRQGQTQSRCSINMCWGGGRRRREGKRAALKTTKERPTLLYAMDDSGTMESGNLLPPSVTKATDIPGRPTRLSPTREYSTTPPGTPALLPAISGL